MNELIDKNAREKIESQLDRNFFVEAGAGSGKTYCLVERMLNLVKKGKANMENIAAVTFTRKAAAELKERFQIMLENSLREGIGMSPGEKKNVQKALFNLEQIYIGTIHSFCSKILRERPVEAGVDPEFEEIEEEKDYIYAEQAWPDFINYSNENNDKTLKLMEEFGIEINDLKDTYHSFIQYADVEIVSADVKRPDFLEVKKEISLFLNLFREMLPQIIPAKGWDSLQSILKKSINYMDSGYLYNNRLFIRLLNEMNKTPGVVLNRWPDGNGRDCEQKMLQFQDDVIKPVLKSWQEYMHKPLTEFIKKGVDFYSNWRNCRSILNFEDLLTVTSNLLRKNSEIRKYFKSKFTHILVDEFQDTDPIQAEIIFFLTGKNITETDWKNIILENGALFLVGDPKQSIYRFRRADIDIYNTVKKMFSRENCEVLPLFSNFRSLPFMQDVVESVFKKIMPDEEDSYQAKYFPLNTTRELDDSFNFGLYENNIEKTGKGNASEITQADASKIADWIYGAVNADGMKFQRTKEELRTGLTQKPEYCDFLILTKKRQNLGIYSRALEKNGIPYDISGGLVFNESLEIGEILRLFKAIDDNRDPVALVAALRGLFFGISDELLYNFKKAGGKFSYYSLVPDGFIMFSEAFNRLKEFKEIINKNMPTPAAEIIIEKTGIIPLVLSEEEGLTKAGNIYKAIELLKNFESEKIETFFDLIKNLEEILKNREIESMSLLASKKNVVRIMNLHKAKGLEATVVILADPMGETGHFEPRYHISRTEGKKARGYFSITRPTSSYSSEVLGIPPDWSSKVEEEKKYEEAERRRLEYVAATRAKNILAVSTYREGEKAKAWELLYDYLKSAQKIEIPPNMGFIQMETIEISKPEWDGEKKKIKDNLNKISSASYDINKVTSEAKENYIFTGSSGGKGAKWGSICHKAVELAGRGCYENLKELTAKWIEEEEIDTGTAGEIVSLVDRLMKTSLWKRIIAADQKYFEAPFAQGSVGAITYGVIDVIFKENGKWIIVDYKTDDFEDNLEKKTVYLKQLALYKKYWESISGQEVSEMILYKL